MAAPNLLNLTTGLGRSTVADLTTTNSSILANASSSGKVYKINSITVSNIDGTNSCDTTISFRRSSTDYKLAHLITVPAKSTLVVLSKDQQIYLEEEDAIFGQAAANSDLQIIISYEELY